ncbi:hypothetical protein ACLOJK_035942 [Asimina triloba]
MLGEDAGATEHGFEGLMVHVLEEQGHVIEGLVDDAVATDQVGGAVGAAKDVDAAEDLVAGGGVGAQLDHGLLKNLCGGGVLVWKSFRKLTEIPKENDKARLDQSRNDSRGVT